MGIQDIGQHAPGSPRTTTQGVLTDLRAMERMLERNMFESGITRIGAEQELVLVNDAMQPAPLGPELLELLDDPRATPEIGRFNLEFNCTPRELAGPALALLHAELDELMGKARHHGASLNVSPLLIGILPTLETKHLGREYITPKDRYYALDDLITKARGGKYDIRIKGIDELRLSHDSVMLEALNTSFQLHYQCCPDTFVRCFNTAQLITAPLLALAANSAVLMGKRLWHETRIAIFEQTVDTAGSDIPAERELVRRVRFGERWAKDSVLELFRADLARFRMLFGPEITEDSVAVVEEGRAPKLAALQTFNSTLYRWNRPCYGVTNGKPHLRIENRYIPAGPTIDDQVANAALWFGLMKRFPEIVPDIPDRLSFTDAKANFVSAARAGLDVKIRWIDDRAVPVRDLLVSELIPIAQEGLRGAGIDGQDIDRYLSIVQQRTETGRNGARWMLDSVDKIHDHGTRAQRLAMLTAGTLTRQRQNIPVHEWSLADIDEAGEWKHHYAVVGQYMNTDLYTVHEDELVDLVASIMDWEKVRHIPVENDAHQLVGLVSYRAMLKLVADTKKRTSAEPIPVADLMQRDPVCATPDTPTLDAIALMREHKTSCLPVVNADKKLVGIVTEHDYMRIAGRLLEEHLRAPNHPPG